MNTPTDNRNDEAERRLAESAKTLFDDSVEQLDAATLSKLNRGRQAALGELSARPRGLPWLRWAPATGLAAAALLAVVMFRGPSPEEPPVAQSATDFEILIGEDSLEMIEELEFYSWLDLIEAEATDNVG